MLARQQARTLRPAAAKAVSATNNARFVRALPQSTALAPGHVLGLRKSSGVLVRAAAKEEVDFDKFLIIIATKWEEAENKPVVVGYSAAFVLGFFFLEWFIHLPLFNFLLGFPIQLVGLATLPWLLTRWLVDKKDWYQDASDATGYLVSKLPYLEKEKK